MAKTRTTTSHYEVQKLRRADWLQYWKDNQRTIVTGESVVMVDTPRRMKRGVMVNRRPTRRPIQVKKVSAMKCKWWNCRREAFY